MKKLLLILIVMLNTSVLGQNFPGTGNGLNSCGNFTNFDWSKNNINDYISMIQELQDKLAKGIETHGNIGIANSILDAQKSGMMEMATVAMVNPKIVVELDETADRDNIKSLQTYLGLSLMGDSIGEYKRYIDNANFKVCLSAKEMSKHDVLLETVKTIVKDENAVTVVENCPSTTELSLESEINNQ